MIRSLIRCLAGSLALSLAGCNVVVSDHPWFTASADDPRFSPGLWVALQSEDCSVVATAKLSTWPECAKPFFVRGAELLSPPEAKAGEPPIDPSVFTDLAKWKATSPVLVNGQPMVLQLRTEPIQTDGAVMPSALPAGEGAKFYLYLAVNAVAREPDGAVRSVRVWPVFCGPPPPPAAKGQTQKLEDLGSSGVSHKPFPGIHRGKVGCEADNAAAIRKAAALSEGVAVANEMPPFSARWLRNTLAP